jgi:dihydroxyacetone kinase DhaKLM complex PTS-EIIA-like component DhaM
MRCADFDGFGQRRLGAEMAVELLPPKMAQKIRFCPARVVEGAMSAGVQISGRGLDQVYNEAAAALAQGDHLGHLAPR